MVRKIAPASKLAGAIALVATAGDAINLAAAVLSGGVFNGRGAGIGLRTLSKVVDCLPGEKQTYGNHYRQRRFK